MRSRLQREVAADERGDGLLVVNALDVTDDAHDLGGVVARTALVGDGQVAAEHVGQLLGGLGATHIGGDDDQVLGVEVHVVVVLAKQRQCGQVVNRDIEEALDLTLVQVEGDDAVNAGALEQIGDEAGGDRLARAGLAVLAGIAVVGDNGGDGAGGCALGIFSDFSGSLIGITLLLYTSNAI